MIKKRILVVDDDESLRRVMPVQLQQSGDEVTSAAGGSEALERLEVCDLVDVLLDLALVGFARVELGI